MKTFADKINEFNSSLEFTGRLPEGICIMNPFKDHENTIAVSSAFYKKYYSDYNSRYLILGINPGRFGAGLTGIPFTDPKRLATHCGIEYHGEPAHEPSSVFIYDMIDQYGGPAEFYNRFYFNSVSPLGFTKRGVKGNEVNYNYYDQKELIQCLYDFMIENIKKQISFGINTDIGFCLGTGKNEKFLLGINNQFGFFKKIIALEHPRYIMQYKSRYKMDYIRKYLDAFDLTK